MRALVLTGPREASVQQIDAPLPSAGEVVVDVQRAGICGTDVELYTGEMEYLHDGNAAYPLRIGHEWMGTVTAIADDVDRTWLGARVTGDTMLGCRRCSRCTRGQHHVCEYRTELGIRGGRPGALAEKVAVPAWSLHRLPDTVDDSAGAMVEPGGNAWRSVHEAQISPGERVLVLGPGTIGLLCAMFAKARGAEVHVLGRPGRSLDFAKTFAWDGVWTEDDLPRLPWHAVIDASSAPHFPNLAVSLAEPGRRVVFVGLAGTPSYVDTRLIALKDLTAVGILGASAGLAPTIDAYATGAVDPRPLISSTVTLAELPSVLAGGRPQGSGPGPKTLVSIFSQETS